MTHQCLSVFGHKFRARYSEEWTWPEHRFKLTGLDGPVSDLTALRNHTRTYERDVCERCGETVDRKVLP